MMRIRKRRSEPVYRANWLSEFEWTDAVDRRDEGSEAGTKSAKQEVAARGVRAAVPWTTIEAALAGVGWS